MALNRESRLSTGATDLFDEALEEDEDDFESTGTEEDLISTVDPEIFDRTFEVTKSDVPLAVGDEIPILRPWQGIPRMAMVFNFNYVWDSEEEKWVKDEGNGGGGGVQGGSGAFLDSSQTIPDSLGTTRVELDTTLYDTIDAFDAVSHEFTAPDDGLYHVEASVQYQAASVAGAECLIRAAGLNEADQVDRGTDMTVVAVSKTIQLSSGDTVHLETSHDEPEGETLSQFRSACYMTFVQL